MKEPIAELSAIETVDYLRATPTAKLIDVRTDEEYALAHISSALLVNTPQMAATILALPRETPLVFQCHHGLRSLQAAQWFRAQGFTTVFNLSGGIEAWSQTVDPSIRRY